MPDIDRLLNAIETAEGQSYGSDGVDGQLSDDRASALNAYFGENTFPAPEGQSQVISRDLFDTVEWITPSLTRIFAGTDEIVKVEPISPEDVNQARQETLFLNHYVTQRINWEQVFHDWAKDALLTKNAYCLAFWDDSKEVEYETYERQSEDAFALLMEDDVEVIEHSEYVDEDELKRMEKAYNQAVQQFQMQVQQYEMAVQQGYQGPPPSPPVQPPPPMLHSVKIRRTRENGKLNLRVLPPERCSIHQSTPDYTLKDCDFFEYWEETSISKLRSMGFDVDDDIDSDERGYDDTQEDEARDRYNEDQSRGESWDPSMRKVRARMVWIRHDYDEDGIAELQYCLVVGKNILFREECNRIPVASIVATPVPHRHIGISIADVVMDIQETKTQMLRQGIDNLFHANNPRLFLNEGKIDLDDALVSRPGGVVRGKAGEMAVFGQDIAPIVIPNVFPQAIQGMEYMDQVKQNRVGVNNYFTGTDENALNKTAKGVNILTGQSAQRVEQIARMMAPSVEYLFSVCHELILKHGHKKEVIRIKGEWVPVDPSNWRHKRDLKIAVGLGSGSKDAMIGHLMQIFQAQMATIPMGITDPEKVYNTLSELTKAAGFPTEALFWKKPGPPQQPPPPPEVIKEQMRQQFESQQNEMDRRFEAYKLQVQEQSKTQIAEMQDQTKQMIAAFDGWLKLQDQTIQSEFEKQRMAYDVVQKDLDRVHQTASQAAIESARASAKPDESDTKESLNSMAQAFSEKLEGIAKTMQGSKVVGIQKIKGPDGRMIGARRMLADGTTEEIPIQ